MEQPGTGAAAVGVANRTAVAPMPAIHGFAAYGTLHHVSYHVSPGTSVGRVALNARAFELPPADFSRY